MREPLSTASDIRDCELAAASLQNSLQQELPSGVEVLQAVMEQTQAFKILSASFGKRLFSHLSGLFTLNVRIDHCMVMPLFHCTAWLHTVYYNDGECACATHEWSQYLQS